MDGPAFTNNVSMIFNKVFQEQQLKSLQKSLINDQNNVLATILSERLKSSFGLKALPSLDDVLPFIHFDESGQTHFTLIYTSSLLSPFSLICSHYFSRHVMNLQREVYHMIYTNTLNISDSDAEGDEDALDEQPPPVLSYANGVTRDSVYQKTGSSNAAATSTQEERRDDEEEEEEGIGGEDSSESLLSYSMSALISPAIRCPAGSLAAHNAAKQRAHDSSQSCSPPDAATELPSRSESSRTVVSAKVQLSKKYKCDCCAKVRVYLFSVLNRMRHFLFPRVSQCARISTLIKSRTLARRGTFVLVVAIGNAVYAFKTFPFSTIDASDFQVHTEFQFAESHDSNPYT